MWSQFASAQKRNHTVNLLISYDLIAFGATLIFPPTLFDILIHFRAIKNEPLKA